jgi:hypothetical protein
VLDFSDHRSLLNYLKNRPHPKLVFQIHPERWTDHKFEFFSQYLKDKAINLIKALV